MGPLHRRILACYIVVYIFFLNINYSNFSLQSNVILFRTGIICTPGMSNTRPLASFVWPIDNNNNEQLNKKNNYTIFLSTVTFILVSGIHYMLLFCLIF